MSSGYYGFIAGELADAGADDDCGGCTCCDEDTCFSGPGGDCPTDSLGDSICPCTEAF